MIKPRPSKYGGFQDVCGEPRYKQHYLVCFQAVSGQDIDRLSASTLTVITQQVEESCTYITLFQPFYIFRAFKLSTFSWGLRCEIS